jgi:hypothetical protein
MTVELDSRNADQVVTQIEKALSDYGWRGREGGAGWAMVRLFGRLSELVIKRLNRVPEKHFLAFLNEAGVDLLPPRPATAELSFNPAKDGPAFIRVPAGTQVATAQTETEPEVIFETQRDVIVAPNVLVKCIAFDHVCYSDQTAKATGQESGSFAAFKGGENRERILYIADDQLFTFDDDASRKAAEITLCIDLAAPGDHVTDGWKLEWLFWNGTGWTNLKESGATVTDETDNLTRNGHVVLANLPELNKTEVDEVSVPWIACELTGGAARNHLPVLSNVTGKCEINIGDENGNGSAADGAFSAIQGGTAFVPVDPGGEFFPLGQRPTQLDAFYLRADEAFNKKGARVSLNMDLTGLPETPEDSSELEKLTLVWEYYGDDGWTELGTSTWNLVTPITPGGFDDTTYAFTRTVTQGVISLDVPDDFAKTRVNDQEGYWVRARVMAGSYDVPGGMREKGGREYEWIEPKTYAPLIKRLKIDYTGYTFEIQEKRVDHCLSRVDGSVRDHSTELVASQTFAPFSAADEGPALYLAFQQAFPAGKWIQLLLDVEEGSQNSGSPLQAFWEYWNGSQWIALRVSDGTQGLSKRGYLGFFGPDGHQSSTEFKENAYWLRARPHLSPLANAGSDQERPVDNDGAAVALDASGSRAFDRHRKIACYTWRLAPLAKAGDDQEIRAEDDEAAVTLDASSSRAFDGQGIPRYTWQIISSSPLVADAGPDNRVTTAGHEATVQLDGSGSKSLTGQPIVKYIWRRPEPEKQNGKPAIAITSMPYLKVVRPNSIPALNAVSVKEEVLGSSNGKPDQVFSLLGSLVLPGAQIAVREPDRPSDDELKKLQKELQQVDETALALLTAPGEASGKGVWVRWHQVSDFYASGPASRHFTLDPISGQVGFGNGKRGKIPPVGGNNINAVFYRTHDGAKGNAAAGTITVLRNPTGDLANIKSVTNYEKAAGGSDAERVDEVKLRGPQRLKHRQRAVTIEDFAWLAREASGEVARARCLPTRNRKGLPKAGWVTVVITPESKVSKPMPSPALLRCVETYLKDRALANLKEVDQIYVKGPEYIEATVVAKVAPKEPEKSDEVKLGILKHLEAFLHPLQGGPGFTGWELGRDVYLSEVYAEIEGVGGVDHVAKLILLGSLQQYRVRLKKEGDVYRKVPFDLPTGSRVTTFDERIKLVLAEPVIKKDDKNDDLKSLDVYGFKVGDEVTIVADDNSVVMNNLKIASLSGDRSDYITFDTPFVPPSDWDQRDALMSSDGRLRLPLTKVGIPTRDPDGKVTGLTVECFKAEDKVSVVVGTRRDPVLEFLPVEQVESCKDRIFVPEGHTIHSGSHDIEMTLE